MFLEIEMIADTQVADRMVAAREAETPSPMPGDQGCLVASTAGEIIRTLTIFKTELLFYGSFDPAWLMIGLRDSAGSSIDDHHPRSDQGSSSDVENASE